MRANIGTEHDKGRGELTMYERLIDLERKFTYVFRLVILGSKRARRKKLMFRNDQHKIPLT